MTIAITVKDRKGAAANIQFDRYPDQCPRCHRSIDVKADMAASIRSGELLQFICRCTSANCDEFFIAAYSRDYKTGQYMLSHCAPFQAVAQGFQATVAEVSPTFVEIFNQAMVAQSGGLQQLVGIGLRKALEFLIKDFSSHQHPEQTDAIKKVALATCIENYVTDVMIKETAKRAAWLGNDETHYVRKWEDKDIRDLQLLVRLTTNWIDSVLLTQKYVAEMPPGG